MTFCFWDLAVQAVENSTLTNGDFMSWDLIRAIQKTEDLRLILPFGLNLRPGDIVAVNGDGNFSLQSDCFSLLGIRDLDVRAPAAQVDLDDQSGKDVTVAFRSATDASSIFPNLPKGSAGLDITLGAANSWRIASVGRSLEVLEDLNRFTNAVLRAADPEYGVWQSNWALVTGVATVQKMTLLAAKSANTKVALNFNADITPQTPKKVQLTADVSVVATSQSLTQCILNSPSPAFCTAMRVRTDWLGRRKFGALTFQKQLPPAEEFWEKLLLPNASGASGSSR